MWLQAWVSPCTPAVNFLIICMKSKPGIHKVNCRVGGSNGHLYIVYFIHVVISYDNETLVHHHMRDQSGAQGSVYLSLVSVAWMWPALVHTLLVGSNVVAERLSARLLILQCVCSRLAGCGVMLQECNFSQVVACAQTSVPLRNAIKIPCGARGLIVATTKWWWEQEERARNLARKRMRRQRA